MAEVISDEAKYRKWIRNLVLREGKYKLREAARKILLMKCIMIIVKSK